MHLKYIKSQSGSFWAYQILLLFVAIASVLFFTSCKNDKEVAANKDVYYTCSMHPQINEPKPGKCPICGMDLIQVQKSQAPDKRIRNVIIDFFFHD